MGVPSASNSPSALSARAGQYDNGDHDDRYSRGDDVENVVTRLLGQLCPTAMEFSEVKPFDRQKLFTLLLTVGLLLFLTFIRLANN